MTVVNKLKSHRVVWLVLSIALSGCVVSDDNDSAVYGKESGLPINCRAYVQTVIDGYRSKQFTADESMNGLERNCGKNGHAWKNNR